MKLASFIKDGKQTYGGLYNDRLVDLGPKFGGRFPDLKALIGGGGLTGLATFIGTGKDWMPLEVAEFLPVIPNPGKIFCVGHELCRPPDAEMGRGVRPPRHLPSLHRDRWPRRGRVVPKVSDQARFRGRTRRRHRQARPVHRPTAQALDTSRATPASMTSIRDLQRHTAQFTPGKNFPRAALWARGWSPATSSGTPTLAIRPA